MSPNNQARQAGNQPFDENSYPRSLESDGDDPFLGPQGQEILGRGFTEGLSLPRKLQLSTPSFLDNQFTAHEPLGTNNTSEPEQTISYPAATIANTNRVPTEGGLLDDLLASHDSNGSESNGHNLEIHLQPPPEEGSDHGDRRRTESVHSGHSDFTHVTPVEDFGLTVGMEHIKQQIREGHLCPKFSTRMRDDASTHSHHSDLDTRRSESADFKGIGDRFEDKPQIPVSVHGNIDDKPIVDQLEERVKSAYAKQDFLPWDELLVVLGEANVERELAMHFSPARVQELLNEIFQDNPKTSRRILMAVLCYIEKPESIDFFVKKDIHDADLPFREEPDMELDFATHRNRKARKRCYAPTDLPPKWPQRTVRLFCREQYSFLVPFFDMTGQHVNFYQINENGIILPFLKWEGKSSGGYGTVWQAQIHRAHHNWRPSKSYSSAHVSTREENPLVAVKEIHSDDYEAYKEEVRVLERFSGQQRGHDHLVRLLMAFQHDSKYFLVFPLAEGGNLKHVWETTDKDTSERNDVLWLLRQCRGITEGLWKIHKHESWFANGGLTPSLDNDKNRGRHGDIKPQNILAFETDIPGEYRLVISDFGLTRFHSAISVSNVPLEQVAGLSFTYRAPEIDQRQNNQRPSISQAYDMWSLGCLFLELISWFLLGYNAGPKTFGALRTKDDKPNPSVFPTVEDKFFNIVDNEVVVKPSVKQWIHKLRQLENCPSSIRDFLFHVENDLLVPVQARVRVDKFHATLAGILSESERKPYYCVPTPVYPRSKRPAEIAIAAQYQNESKDDILASRRESVQLQKAILEHVNIYRTSQDLTRQAVSLHQESTNFVSSGSAPASLRGNKRLSSPDRGDKTIKASNYRIAGQAEGSGTYEQQTPRTAGVPDLARNASTLTESTTNPSQVSGTASFTTKATTPPQFSRECTPDRDHQAAAIINTGQGDAIALSVIVDDAGRADSQHIPSPTTILHTVADSFTADKPGLPTVDEQTSPNTSRINGPPVEHGEETEDGTVTAENSPSPHRAMSSEAPTRTRSPTPQSPQTRPSPVVHNPQSKKHPVPHHPDDKHPEERHSNFKEGVSDQSLDEERSLVAGTTSDAINEPATKQGRGARKYWTKLQNVMKATRIKLHDSKPRSRDTIST